jgi:predicted metal-dependent TIM-barrel fold hydrolase
VRALGHVLERAAAPVAVESVLALLDHAVALELPRVHEIGIDMSVAVVVDPRDAVPAESSSDPSRLGPRA